MPKARLRRRSPELVIRSLAMSAVEDDDGLADERSLMRVTDPLAAEPLSYAEIHVIEAMMFGHDASDIVGGTGGEAEQWEMRVLESNTEATMPDLDDMLDKATDEQLDIRERPVRQR